MEKVKITQAQADAIEELNSEFSRVMMVEAQLRNKDKWENGFAPLNGLHTDKFIHALYIGYEVEPEYGINDWIVYENEYHKVVMRITGVFDGKIEVEPYHEGFTSYNKISTRSPLIRLATPSEIAEEKERRTEKKLDKLLLDLSNSERIKLYDKLKAIGSSFDE